MPDTNNETNHQINQNKTPQDINLGLLYRGIKGEISQDVQDKQQSVQDPKYVQLCKSAYKRFPSLARGNLHKKVKDAVLFLGWKLKPEEYNAFVMTIVVFGLGSLLVLLMLIFFIYNYLYNHFEAIDFNPYYVLAISFVVLGTIVGYLIYHFMNYPLVKAEEEKRKALAYLPAIVGYLTMYLKLVPNLERAIQFAAIQGEGHLAEDLRKIIWDTNIGVYSSISEGLDYLAYRWKAYSMDFKEAVMMIKSAMVEDNETRRVELLDKTTDNLLGAIKLKMETYARALSQPSLVLFYIGVLLPLLLVIILPIGSVFAKLPFSNPFVLAGLYDVAIPLFVFLYAKKISRTVPLLYRSPVIPDGFKGVPKKGNFYIGRLEINIIGFLIFLFVILMGLTIFLQYQFGQTMEKVMIQENLPQEYIDNPDKYFDMLAENYMSAAGTEYPKRSSDYQRVVDTQKLLYSLKPEHDTTPYFILYGFALILALIIALYCYLGTVYKKKVQDHYMDMEQNFREILFILASRLSEGKPIETALKDTMQFFPDLIISQDLLAKTVDNINLLGMPLEQALFDPLFGSLRNNPSTLIKNNMKIIADSSQLGVGTVAKTILSISLQLKNIEDIRITVQKLTDDVKQMMTTMASIIAPAVLGMVSAIQKVVILTLSSLGSSSSIPTASSNSNLLASSSMSGLDLSKLMMSGLDPSKLMGSIDPTAIGSIASPFAFNLILAINLILVVLGLVYFISRVESDNPIKMKMNIAYMIPVAVVVFILASLGASFLLGGLGA